MLLSASKCNYWKFLLLTLTATTNVAVLMILKPSILSLVGACGSRCFVSIVSMRGILGSGFDALANRLSRSAFASYNYDASTGMMLVIAFYFATVKDENSVLQI